MAKNEKIKINRVLGHKKWIEVEVEENSAEHKAVLAWNKAMNYTVNQDRKELKRQNEREEKEVSADYLYEESGYEIPDNDSLNPMKVYERKQLQEEIAKAMSQLSEIQRTVVYRVIWENKSLNAIAKEDGKNPSTIREAYISALDKLRAWLKNYQDF